MLIHRKLLSYTFFLSVVSCNQSTDNCLITSESILRSQAKKIFVIDGHDGLPNDICDRGEDSINMVGSYTFFKSGALKSYAFYSSGDTFTYKEDYDSLGNLVNTTGTPMVLRDIQTVVKDSSVFKEYFFTLNRSFEPFIRVTINNKNTKLIKLEEDSLRSNILFFKVGFNTSTVNKIEIATSVKFTNLFTGKSQIATDSTEYFRD